MTMRQEAPSSTSFWMADSNSPEPATLNGLYWPVNDWLLNLTLAALASIGFELSALLFDLGFLFRR